ncbi:MAG: protein-L-isoaspartate(D-aspartate) O-methyltransferase [Spartobacteria bacterium]|nr:protein-L-isoaspartate(D-aspartate) O-methyltransferase [Spartobacteria bacterium]
MLFDNKNSKGTSDHAARRKDVPGINWAARRKNMVELLQRYNIKDRRILQAMEEIPRHLFIPEPFRKGDAYDDHPCPIGFNQTISQPFIVAYMLEKMDIQPHQKILEIGAGSGYQAAVIGALGARIFSIEIIPELAAHAHQIISRLGYENITISQGDGSAGWPDEAPFDVIIAACAPVDTPPALVSQLADDGHMIVPVGRDVQRLMLFHKKNGKLFAQPDLAVRFVPMV